MLTVGHAKCLLTISDKEKQLDYYNFIISKKFIRKRNRKFNQEKS